MTECKHKWEMTNNMPICVVCKTYMPIKEAAARLNATERLSAEDARMASLFITPECNIEYRLLACLFAYADAMEDK